MSNKFSKIDIIAHYHIDLTINGEVVNVDKAHRYGISYAIESHNEMVERIEYLESVLSDFMSGRKPKTSVSKVKYISGCAYSGNGFSVVAGHGEIPAEFTAESECGIRFKARKTIGMRGGGHGEGAAYPVEEYEIDAIDKDGKPCGTWGFGDKIFLITEVVNP